MSGPYLKRLLGLIAMVVLQNSPAEAADPVVAEMHCLSLNMNQSTTVLFGTQYNLFLSATENSTSPGEMRPSPFTDRPTTVEGFYHLTGQGDNSVEQSGEISLELPPFADANGNGVDDFFEAIMPLGQKDGDVIQTSGTFYDPRGGPTKLIATWSRDHKSKTGNVEIQMACRSLHLTITFNVQFRILEYKGSLQYSPGENDGRLTLNEQPPFGYTLSGTISFGRAYGGGLSLPGFELLRDDGTLVSMMAASPELTLSTNGYSGTIHFNDGDPFETAEPDYTTWSLSVLDPQLANVLGPPSPPRLQITSAGTTLTLMVSGEANISYVPEQTSDLGQGWSQVRTITMTKAVEWVTLPLPDGNRMFYRLRSVNG